MMGWNGLPNVIVNGFEVSMDYMRPRFLNLLESCVDNGITLGYNRAHKHTDTPEEHQVKEAIYNAIMHEIHEWFEFPEMYKDES